MMLKTTDNLALHPVSRISPVLSILNIGNPALPIGAPDTPSKNPYPEATLGLLKLVQLPESPVETSTTQVSAAAHLIDNVLKQADVKGISGRLEAQAVVTQEPANSDVIARDLKAAIQNSGLFYESHLSQYIEGHRTLEAIKQEPQNQTVANNNVLLPQQLNVLENQRLSWHGDVWPNQHMHWDVHVEEAPEREFFAQNERIEPSRRVNSELTLHLLHLGKVSAKLSMQDGRMQIKLLAEDDETLKTMKSNSAALAEAIQNYGQIIEGLTVNRDE